MEICDLGAAPPALGQVVNRLLDQALAVGPPRRTGIYRHGVVFGHPDERWLDAVGAGNLRPLPSYPPASAERCRPRRQGPGGCP